MKIEIAEAFGLPGFWFRSTNEKAHDLLRAAVRENRMAHKAYALKNQAHAFLELAEPGVTAVSFSAREPKEHQPFMDYLNGLIANIPEDGYVKPRGPEPLPMGGLKPVPTHTNRRRVDYEDV